MKKSIYNKLLISFLFLSGVNISLKAQAPNPVSFNTAVNAGLNGTIPLLSNDLSWTASTVNINGPYVPAVRASNQAAWLTSPFTTADWITFPHSCNFDPTNHTCLGIVDEYFRLIFTLPASVCGNSVNTPGGYCLTMNFFADNCVNEIIVNGVSSYSNPSPSYIANDFSATGGKTVTICNNWQAGTNTLVVHIKSGLPTAGLLAFITATATSPGGFSVSSTQNNVSCFSTNTGSAMVSLPGYSGPATYSWLPSGGSNSIATNLGPGIYTVNIQLPLCGLTNTLSVVQQPSFAVNVSTTQTICKGAKKTFTAAGGEAYNWLPGNVSGAVVTFSPASTTVYTVTATNSLGCTSSTSFTQQVISCVGMAEYAMENLKVHNNTSGNLAIVTDGDRELMLEITDLSGAIKYKGSIHKQAEIDVSTLAGGIYILRLSDNNSSVRKRILVGR